MVRSLFAQLSRESFVYGLSAALAKLVGLVLVPLYTRLLSPADYGTLGLLVTGTSILTSLLMLGLDAGTALRFYQTEDVQERRVIASTFLYFELLLASCVCAGLFLLAEPLAYLLFGSSAFTGLVQLSVATVPFATFITMFLDVARLVRLPARYLTLSVGNLVLTAILILVGVLGLRLGLVAVLVGTLVGNITFSLVGWWMTRPQYTRVFSPVILRGMLVLGLPLVPATVAYWVINFSNRWFLSGITSLDQVAIYGVATNLCAPVMLLVTAFQIAWVPFSLSIARNESAAPMYARTLLYYLAVTLAMLLLITVFADPLIVVFATPVYLPAAQILALVGLGVIASGAYYIVATGVNLTGRTLHIGWTTVVAALVSIALSLTLIPVLGIVGAAVAGCVANLIPVVLLYAVAQRLYRVPYDLPRISALIGVGAAFLAAATLLHGTLPALDLALRVALVLGFGLALLLLGVIRVRDLQELQRLVRGALHRGASALMLSAENPALPARPRICIISFSPIQRDARVLRQIEYLARDFDLTVIGYGAPHPGWTNVQWAPVATRSTLLTRALGLLWLILGRAWPGCYERWYWEKPHHRDALALARQSGAVAFLANDWNALPIAARAAVQHRARLVLDAHEYAPLEYENRRYWLLLYAPLVVYMLRKYGRALDAAMTVVEPIAARYKREFGFDSLVVMNTPKLVPLPPKRAVEPEHIHLIHHGGANRDRHLELMIETLAQTDRRFYLHFILVDGPPEYVQWLKDLAQRRAPGRITFHDPVPPAEIVARIAEYDIGFFLLKPVNYSYEVALPNKFFDFLAAGLAICIGPSPAMAALVAAHGCGCVAPTFDPADVAALLNRLTAAQVQTMQQAAYQAARQFTADQELAKVVQLFHRLLDRSA